jgi:hypothetical protein
LVDFCQMEKSLGTCTACICVEFSKHYCNVVSTATSYSEDPKLVSVSSNSHLRAEVFLFHVFLGPFRSVFPNQGSAEHCQGFHEKSWNE